MGRAFYTLSYLFFLSFKGCFCLVILYIDFIMIFERWAHVLIFYFGGKERT